MIVVLSQEAHEPTTEAVLDWIEALGGDGVRMNGEDLSGQDAAFALRLDGPAAGASIRLGDREVATDEVRAVWLRRWHGYRQLDFSGKLGDPALERAVSRHLVREVAAATDGLHELLRHASWLTHPRELQLGKLRALRAAARAGLDVPATLVTNSREELRACIARHGRIIAKCVGDVDMFRSDDDWYAMYTVEVTPGDLDTLPEYFLPSLAQELLEKAYELRVVVIDGECHAMAMLTQSDARTSLDFRRYDHARPTRCIPYRLPAGVEDGLRRMMDDLELTTGSVDLVRTRDGRCVFLEVNVAGQLSMVSQPCNYRLEKKVAEALMKRDSHA